MNECYVSFDGVKVDNIVGAASYLYVLFLGDDYFLGEVFNNFVILSPSSIRTILIPDGNSKETITGLASGRHVYAQALAKNAAGKSALGLLSNTIN